MGDRDYGGHGIRLHGDIGVLWADIGDIGEYVDMQ